GHDVTGGPDALDAVDLALLQHGVTSYLAALASPNAELAARAMPELERRAADPGSPLAGVHIEGPFISREYAGAHPPERIAPVPAEVPDWMRSPAVAVVTIAPELDGAARLIAELDRLGVTVSRLWATPRRAQARRPGATRWRESRSSASRTARCTRPTGGWRAAGCCWTRTSAGGPRSPPPRSARGYRGGCYVCGEVMSRAA